MSVVTYTLFRIIRNAAFWEIPAKSHLHFYEIMDIYKTFLFHLFYYPVVE